MRTERAAGAGLGLLGRLPIRLLLQVAIAVAVILFAGIGAYRTIAQGSYQSSAWRDLLVAGVSLGAVYALIALGYTMVYGVLRMINFAHGEVFMSGAFASFFAARTMQRSGLMNRSPVLAMVVLFATAIAGSVVVAVLLERIAYRPLRNSPRLVPLITAIGASLFLQETARGLFGNQSHGYPTPAVLGGRWIILGVPFLRTKVVVIVVAMLAMVALQWFVKRTRTGKSMRAVAEDRETASLMGIDVDRVIVTTFVIGGIMAGVAAVLFALVFQVVDPTIGFAPGIKAFTAAVLGGIGSIPGAALGGMILGILESIGPSLFLTGYHVPGTNQLQDVIAFAILVLVLIFRPGGILGSDQPEKV